MTFYEFGVLLISAVSAGLLLLQVRVAIVAVRADHERRKKQATLEFVHHVRPIWIETKHVLEEKWGNDPLTSKELVLIENDIKLRSVIRNALGSIEHMAVGMNSGVFDKDLLYRMSGTHLISFYDRLHGYIKQKRLLNTAAYTEYEALITDFRERKRNRPETQGDIQWKAQ